MDVHASPAPLPEQEEFLASFQCVFVARREHKPWNAT
jgi:hypothetical protein